MTRPLTRAIPFALAAFIASALASALALIVLVGVPGSREAAAEFQQRAIAQAVSVDLVVGGVLMLLAGWLAARPFRGRTALVTGLLVGLVYILADLIVVIVFGNASRLELATTGLSYAVKLGAAMLGGLFAGRSGPADPALPEQP